jgi:APA family basic amino acid/polyamine antiporter
MVVGEVVGVGIFLTPATMMRTLGTPARALVVWAVMGALSAAGALCYAELTTRFPQAGGAYVYLREAFGPRCAFVYGWMALLVVDPGLTAALGIGFSQYLLATTGGSAELATPVAVAAVVVFGLLTLLGLGASVRLLRGALIAKLTAVALLVVAALFRANDAAPAVLSAAGATPLGPAALAASFIAAFFAFGGWWDVGRMSEEVESPRRTMPRVLLGGVALVTAIYVMVTAAFVLTTSGTASSDEAMVAIVGAGLFGERAARLLALIVVIAVSGSLAAVLLGAPRVYLAMSRDRLFPARLARFDARRGTLPGATAVQVTLAVILVLLGTFDQILGFFVPGAIFFLGLSAAAVVKLPRPAPGEAVFRSPWHPLPIVSFLLLIVAMLALFAVGQPRQTLLGAAIIALGIPAGWLVLPRGAR